VNLTKLTPDANSGSFDGNRMFFDNDYMVREGGTTSRDQLISSPQVHRGPGYVSTLKMLSTRTFTSECLNSQNVRVKRYFFKRVANHA
jgi:hypothetical protein